MGAGEVGRVGVLFPSGCWDLGLKPRERRMMGKEQKEKQRPKQHHRQVVLVLCVGFRVSA